MRNVPFFNYPEFFTQNKSNFLNVFNDVCSRGAFILQSDLAKFEKNLAEYSGCKYAVGVANATDALEMLFLAGGLGAGDEVIFSTHTMVATASAIYHSGATPVPADVGPDHLIDPASIRKAITKNTKAICVTQLNGRCANMEPILKICEEFGLQLYEDSAQALGAKWNGKSAGTFGVGGCISFYPAKILGCLGDGGAVLCNDEAIYKKLLLYRDHGRGETGDVELWGFNSRLDNMQAAILDVQFKDYSKTIERRRNIAALYEKRLNKLSSVVLPPSVNDGGKHFDVFQNYEIEAKDRDALKVYLKDNGIGTLVQWGGKLVHQFPKLGLAQSLPNAEKAMTQMLMIPMNLFISDEDVEYICDKITAFYSK